MKKRHRTWSETQATKKWKHKMQRPTALGVFNDRAKQTVRSKRTMAHSYTDTDKSLKLSFSLQSPSPPSISNHFFQYHNSFQKCNTIGGCLTTKQRTPPAQGSGRFAASTVQSRAMPYTKLILSTSQYNIQVHDLCYVRCRVTSTPAKSWYLGI